ncbi:MAG: hypothetical protein QM270_03355 [Bacillota bacterium]|nr:hypothetical protein [Bacillota bacterium]
MSRAEILLRNGGQLSIFYGLDRSGALFCVQSGNLAQVIPAICTYNAATSVTGRNGHQNRVSTPALGEPTRPGVQFFKLPCVSGSETRNSAQNAAKMLSFSSFRAFQMRKLEILHKTQRKCSIFQASERFGCGNLKFCTKRSDLGARPPQPLHRGQQQARSPKIYV